MTGARMTGLLLHSYPPAWRVRYGEELEALIVQSSGGERVPWRMALDVLRAGARERLRAAGLGGEDVPPHERARGGSLLVLYAWVLFVVAGVVVQKSSEHWQDVTPLSAQGLPALAFQTLVVASAVGSILVLAGVGAALPSLVAFLRSGGWGQIRRPVGRAVLISALAAGATVGMVVWAHRSTAWQRNGHDTAYALVALVWALLIFACLVAWTAAAVAISRRIRLSAPLLRLEARLAAGVSTTIAGMTIATAVWWVSLAHAAPWFFSGSPVGTPTSPLAPQLVAAGLLMLIATFLAAAGTARALRAVPKVTDGGRTS